ncbi:UspA domain protein [Syntrophobacter sp. SbD1]|nr:UspA domain protein [Syntrophobacter sp. SbD1]
MCSSGRFVEVGMKILVQLDGTEHFLKALEIAGDFAKAKQPEIYVISVLPSIDGMEDHEMRERYEEMLQKLADEVLKTAREVLGDQQADVKGASLSMSATVPIPDALIDFAKSRDIEAIVMGNRGLSASSGIANQFAKQSPCSVHLVKITATQC